MNYQFSAEVYHTLVNGGFFIGVVVQLSICLRRVVAGRSTHPVDWTHGKLLMLRGCKIAIGSDSCNMGLYVLVGTASCIPAESWN